MFKNDSFVSQRLRAISILMIACFSVFALSEASDRLALYENVKKYESARVFLETIETRRFGRLEFQKVAIFHVYDAKNNKRILIDHLRPTDLFFERALYDKQKYRPNTSITVLANSDKSQYYLETGDTKNLWFIIAFSSVFWVFVIARIIYALRSKD